MKKIILPFIFLIFALFFSSADAFDLPMYTLPVTINGVTYQHGAIQVDNSGSGWGYYYNQSIGQTLYGCVMPLNPTVYPRYDRWDIWFTEAALCYFDASTSECFWQTVSNSNRGFTPIAFLTGDGGQAYSDMDWVNTDSSLCYQGTLYKPANWDVTPPPSIVAPLHDEENLIMTTNGYSNFATREYFNYLRINHSGVDLALSPNGTRTASQITAGKTVYAICDGDVEFIHNSGGLYSFAKIRHPNCNGQEVIAYYGHIAVIDGLTAVKADEPVGTVKDWKSNSHLHLTIDTEPERNLSRINQLVCDYTLDANQTVTSLSNCSNTSKLTKNKMLLRVGWGQVRTQGYKDSSGHTYRKNLFISEDAMRQLGFISFFDLYQ